MTPLFVCCKNPRCDAFLKVATKTSQRRFAGRWACRRHRRHTATTDLRPPRFWRVASPNAGTLLVDAYIRGREEGWQAGYRAAERASTSGVQS